MRFHHLLFTLFIFLNACAPTSPIDQSRESLDLLIGDWAFEGTELTETWTKMDLNHYRAVISRSFNGELEAMGTIDIRLHGDSVSYIGNRIGAADDALPIEYRLVSAEESQLRFENVNGIFPQEIGYEINDAHRFSVTMSGTQDGKTRSQSFNYSRLQSN